MINGKRVLALIPARSGSKGLPGKNIKPIAGKPLIAWSIEQGIKSDFIDEVIVSTDSNEIAKIAAKYGATIPFIRPANLSNDRAKTMDVILHAIKYYDLQNTPFDILVLLEPTSPQRDNLDIDTSLEMLENSNSAESIVGISKIESCHPEFLVSLQDGFLQSYLDNGFRVSRRQDIDDLFFYEGSIYASYTHSLVSRKNFYHDRTLGYVVPKWKSFEIDDLTDFIIVEALLKARFKLSEEKT